MHGHLAEACLQIAPSVVSLHDNDRQLGLYNVATY